MIDGQRITSERTTGDNPGYELAHVAIVRLELFSQHGQNLAALRIAFAIQGCMLATSGRPNTNRQARFTEA